MADDDLEELGGCLWGITKFAAGCLATYTLFNRLLLPYVLMPGPDFMLDDRPVFTKDPPKTEQLFKQEADHISTLTFDTLYTKTGAMVLVPASKLLLAPRLGGPK